MANKWKEMFEVRHPFFRPVSRRVIATGLCLGWAAFEFLNDAPVWASVFAIAGAYLFWQFFVAFDPKDYDHKN